MAQNIGANSTALGDGTIAASKNQIVIGSFNVPNLSNSKNPNEKGDYAFILGNGLNDETRNNALTIDWDGNIITNGIIQTKINNNVINFLSEASLASKKTSTGDLRYNSNTADKIIPTINTIAFWDGRYNTVTNNDTTTNYSNLQYFKENESNTTKKFGSMAAESTQNFHKLNARGSLISEGDDLNDSKYWEPGVYRCESNTIALTLGNCPAVGSNFKLIVYVLGYSGAIIQEIQGSLSAGRHFTRIKHGDSIYSWREAVVSEGDLIKNRSSLKLSEGWTSFGFLDSNGHTVSSVQSSEAGKNRLIFNQYKNTGTKDGKAYDYYDRYLLPPPPTNDTTNQDYWYSILTTKNLYKTFTTKTLESDGTSYEIITTSGLPLFIYAMITSADGNTTGTNWALKPLQTAEQTFNLSLDGSTYNAKIAYIGFNNNTGLHETKITATGTAQRKYTGFIFAMPSPVAKTEDE